jgi:hypothetical protein
LLVRIFLGKCGLVRPLGENFEEIIVDVEAGLVLGSSSSGLENPETVGRG